MARRLLSLIITSIFFSVVFTASSCAIEPFEAVALPQGWLFAVYAAHYKASELLNKNGDPAFSNLGFRVSSATLRLSGYNKTLLPHTLNVTLLVPVGRKDLRQDHDAGPGDMTLAAGYWLIDNPETKTYLAVGSFMDMPTGGYTASKTANMGDNVWKFRPSAGFARITDRIHLETALRYNMYTRNRANNFKDGNEFIAEIYGGYYVKPHILPGWQLNAIFGSDKTFRGHDVRDSAVQRIQTGPSLYLKTAKGFNITLTALTEIGVRNSTQGSLFITRFAWRL